VAKEQAPVPAGPAYPISSVDNALRLLLRFREQPSLRLVEASEYLGVAQSTAHRLMAMLVTHGFVRRDARTRTYVPGPALMEIGLAVVQALDVRQVARPVLEHLAGSTEETAALGVLEGHHVRYVDAVESPKALRVAARTGRTLPAHCTSIGRAILAGLDQEQVDALYPRNRRLEALTAHSITTVRELRAELEETRARGYALNREEAEDGVGSVAVALPLLPGQPPAAVSLAAPVLRLTDLEKDGQVIDLLQEAARSIGEGLRRASGLDVR
jgi:DNA-binding IclR family transcriptional regulator